MKLNIDIEPYFCPKCGKFRSANQTERMFNKCVHYERDQNTGKWTSHIVEGIQRSCIECNTHVINSGDLCVCAIKKLIKDEYMYRPDNGASNTMRYMPP